jgi:hypothetical protein
MSTGIPLRTVWPELGSAWIVRTALAVCDMVVLRCSVIEVAIVSYKRESTVAGTVKKT